jgi:uncharacterized protein (TIGR03118 family)
MLTALYQSPRLGRIQLTTLLTVAAGLMLARPAAAQGYRESRLVSDLPGIAAQLDTTLMDPWGITHGPTGPLWVANNGSGMATSLTSGVLARGLVAIAGVTNSTAPARPTGIVFNDSGDFPLPSGSGLPALFLTATEDGTIVGWNPAVNPGLAEVLVNNTGSALYTGLAIANQRLYACNFRTGRIDVFNGDFTPAGSITDATLPAAYAPFNIQNLGGTLYVTFAEQNSAKDGPRTGNGRGFVEAFDPTSGAFRLLISRGVLDSPWGMALAPANFGRFSNSLLIGNFGDGDIHAFDPATGAFLGRLRHPDGSLIIIRGLRGLTFGNGDVGGAQNILYFTAGIDGGRHGLVGNVQAVP